MVVHVIFVPSYTSERVASAMRQRMKQNRPERMVKTMRKTPVLLPNSVLRRLGSRSACVIAILSSPTELQLMQPQEEETHHGFCLSFSMTKENYGIAWNKGCFKAKDSWVLSFNAKYSHKERLLVLKFLL